MPESKMLLSRNNQITSENIAASKQMAAQLEKQNCRIILLKSQTANKTYGAKMFNLLAIEGRQIKTHEMLIHFHHEGKLNI